MALGQLTGVPVLGYHRIVDASSSAEARRWGVHEAAFRQQLQLVRDLSMTVVAPEEDCRRPVARPASRVHLR